MMDEYNRQKYFKMRLTQPFPCGRMIAIDEFAGCHDLFAFGLELQQFQHSPLAAADKKFFIADAEFAGREVCQSVFDPGADEFQALAAELRVCPRPRLKAAQ